MASICPQIRHLGTQLPNLWMSFPKCRGQHDNWALKCLSIRNLLPFRKGGTLEFPDRGETIWQLRSPFLTIWWCHFSTGWTWQLRNWRSYLIWNFHVEIVSMLLDIILEFLVLGCRYWCLGLLWKSSFPSWGNIPSLWLVCLHWLACSGLNGRGILFVHPACPLYHSSAFGIQLDLRSFLFLSLIKGFSW